MIKLTLTAFAIFALLAWQGKAEKEAMTECMKSHSFNTCHQQIYN